MKLVWKQWWSWNNRSAGAHRRVNRCQRLLRARTLCSTLLPLTLPQWDSAFTLPSHSTRTSRREKNILTMWIWKSHMASFFHGRGQKCWTIKRITQALVSPCHSLSGANVPLGVLSDIWEPTSFYISTWRLRCYNVKWLQVASCKLQVANNFTILQYVFYFC